MDLNLYDAIGPGDFGLIVADEFQHGHHISIGNKQNQLRFRFGI